MTASGLTYPRQRVFPRPLGIPQDELQLARMFAALADFNRICVEIEQRWRTGPMTLTTLQAAQDEETQAWHEVFAFMP